MGLSSSLETARQGLSVFSERTTVVSRNVANAQNDHSTRKVAHSASGSGAIGVRLTSINRVSDDALFQNMISSNSSSGQYEAVVDFLNQLNNTIADVEQDYSPAALVGKLADSLQQFSASPQDPILAQNAVFSAIDVANALNEATAVVQDVRTRADQQIADSVDTVNTLLERFEQVNNDVVTGNRFGHEVTDLLDERDKLLSDISREIGIRTITREYDDLAIYTDSGVTLFESQLRTVAFQTSGALGATITGNAVFVDGVQVTGSASPLPISSGRIRGLADIRDDIAVTYQSQLDEIARGLITNFAESDQSAVPSLPDATGLFDYSGSPTVPPAGTIIPGLAAEITVNAAVDPGQSGDPFLLRDGGINGAAYVYNSSGAAGFSDRLRQLHDTFTTTIAFDAAAQAGTSTNLLGFAAESVGWLQEVRQRAAGEHEFRSAVYERAADSLSKKTGINLDYEMTLLLEIERSYQATSRLISTIDNMFESLIEATR